MLWLEAELLLHVAQRGRKGQPLIQYTQQGELKVF